MKYGVIHNNFFYFYYPIKADGTKSKKAYVKRIWVPLGQREDNCLAFDTEEEAQQAAENQFYNERSWKIVECDDDGNIINTPEVEKLKLGYRPTKAEEGERVE